MAQDYDQLVSEFYFAAAHTRDWTRPLRAVAEYAGCRNAIIHHGSWKAGTPAMIGMIDDGEIDHGELSDYPEFVAEHGEPRFQFAERLYRESRLRAFRDQDFIDERDMKRHPYYEDVLNRIGIRYGLVCPLPAPKETGIAVSLQRSRRDGPFEDAAVGFIERLSHHVRQAIELEKILYPRLGVSGSGCKLPWYSTVIRRDRTVLAISSEFESTFLSTGTFRVRGGRLVATSARLDALLRRGVQDAANGGSPSIAVTGRQVALQCIPLVSDVGLFLPAEQVVLEVKPLVAELDPVQVASRRFGLTPSETRVLDGLWRGLSVSSIADERHVSIWTVRAQLKAILRKMKVRSQREVVRTLARLA